MKKLSYMLAVVGVLAPLSGWAQDAKPRLEAKPNGHAVLRHRLRIDAPPARAAEPSDGFFVEGRYGGVSDGYLHVEVPRTDAQRRGMSNARKIPLSRVPAFYVRSAVLQLEQPSRQKFEPGDAVRVRMKVGPRGHLYAVELLPAKLSAR